jgi:hypothetical protein
MAGRRTCFVPIWRKGGEPPISKMPLMHAHHRPCAQFLANLAQKDRIGQGMETGRLPGSMVEKSRA